VAKLFRETEILYEALNAQIGIEIEIVGNYQTSLQALYAAKRTSPDFYSLQIHKSPASPNHLWIVKNPTKQFTPTQSAEQASTPATSLTAPDEPLFTLSDIIEDL
jgi:hypothetical protein